MSKTISKNIRKKSDVQNANKILVYQKYNYNLTVYK